MSTANDLWAAGKFAELAEYAERMERERDEAILWRNVADDRERLREQIKRECGTLTRAQLEDEMGKLRAENAALRADLERFTGHGLLDCHAICDQRDAAIKERDALRAALETQIEYAQSLAAEWSWKRNSTPANNREMARLDSDIAQARALLEAKP